MHKITLASLLFPLVTLASCVSTTPVVEPAAPASTIEHTHKTSSKPTKHVHKHSPKPTKVVKSTKVKTLTPKAPIIPPHPTHPSPTHGIAGQPC